MKHLLFLLALSLSISACAQKTKPGTIKAASAGKATSPAKAATEPVLIFQRTPCYGTCPAYTATIFADGRVEYEGQRSVGLLGKHTLQLLPATVQEMLAEAKRIGFSKLQARYTGNTSDLPATLITVHPVGQPTKAVIAEQDIPANLQSYIQYLQSKLDPLTELTK